MAEKKMTRATALTNVIEYLGADEFEGKWDEELVVLGKMLASIQKSGGKKREGASDKRKQNEKLFDEVYAMMGDETVGTNWVIERITEISSASRVAAVMAIGIERGVVERVKGRYIGYKKVSDEDTTEE